MADEIKVNAAQWQALSPQDQNRVNAILKSAGLLRDAQIVPDPAIPTHVTTAAALFGLGPDVCHTLCSLAEAVAVALCALAPPATQPICIAAAHAAANVCTGKC